MGPSSAGRKRERHVVDDSSTQGTEHASPTTRAPEDARAASRYTTTNFRNVSACNRCRNRKNRCDQKLPRCSGCEKANVKCVGFDPVSKRAIPRSYVYYLETRLRNLEGILEAHGLPVPPPQDDFAISDDIKPGINVPYPVLDEDPGSGGDDISMPSPPRSRNIDPALQERDIHRLDRLANDVGLVSVHGREAPKKAQAAPGVSFARVVLAAVKSSVPRTPSEKGGAKSSKFATTDLAGGGGTSMRDSFFGLYSRPAVKAAPFPDEATGRELMGLYFDYANPQIPILHRGEFESLFEQVYASDPKSRTSRELYLLNIVFAIGSGIIMDSTGGSHNTDMAEPDRPTRKRQRQNQKPQPEEFHAAAVVYLESFLSSPPTSQGSGAGLEELQAVLLLAGLALLRPVSPGLWYIIGVAVRLAIDLGLHSEEADLELDKQKTYPPDSQSVGRKQWARDLRRRLWWCVYAFDKLVSTCVGRPVGISDQVVTTEFPTLLEDKYITPTGFLKAPTVIEYPTSKLVGEHYTRLRLLQSEILQVLQHRSADQTRAQTADGRNPWIYRDLPSPFMSRYPSFRDWRSSVDSRLRQWKDSIPEQEQIGVAFTPLFFELNYFQAVILLYRNSLAVPEPLAAESVLGLMQLCFRRTPLMKNRIHPSTGSPVQSPGTVNVELKEDEQLVFMKVAQAGQCVLKIYRQLHRLKLVNYTFLATHHIFMSGISFLYAIWHSHLVRAKLTLDDVDFTILVATSVLTDLSERCPPAEACRDALIRMSKATIAMVEKTTGFGATSTLSSRHLHSAASGVGYFGVQARGERLVTNYDEMPPQSRFSTKRRLTMPKFDMNLKDLFSDEEIATSRRPSIALFENPNNGGHNNNNPNTTPNKLQQSNTNPTSPYPPDQPNHQQNLSPQSPHSILQQHPYHPFAQTISQSHHAFSSTFDDMDMSFLDTFPVADPGASAGNWGSGSWNDMGFGTGGGPAEGSAVGGEWDSLNGVDLFGGLFFGGDANAGGGGFEL